MKNTAPTKIIILFVFIVLIIAIGASSFALAYWAGAPQLDLKGNDATTVNNDINATSKYLVLAPNGTYDDDYCFEYTDEYGWVLKYEYGSDYVLNGGAHKAGSRNAVDGTTQAGAAIFTAVATGVASNGVKVIGYTGTLGQYEDLIILDSISWNGNNNIEVNKIDIKMTEYKETMDLLTGVEIPSTIDSIDGSSFSGAGNLVKVTFKGSLPTIGTYCFRGMKSGITYYDNSGEPISIRA